MKSLQRIAAELQGYDPNALKAADVHAFLDRLVEPVAQTEDLPLFDALDRVLARDLVSPLNVPPHDNSAMDGYAFAGAQLRAGEPLRLRVLPDTALAGQAWRGQVAAGECLRIMTGAIMPAGLDTVAPQELVQREGDHVIIPPGLLQPGDNRRLTGEDVRQGAPAL
ncbi:MAG: molybdopterin molybdenumtransferase MoeA, partial [Hylemonella sp.]